MNVLTLVPSEQGYSPGQRSSIELWEQGLAPAGLGGVAERLPMKQYAQYPSRVCVNDQFDRFSAPIEFRYTREEARGWFERAELEEIAIRPNYGWCVTGRKKR